MLIATIDVQDLQENFASEQLAYIATLAVGADLIFGDRPKRLTYDRLLTLPTAAELDLAFANQVHPCSACSQPMFKQDDISILLSALASSLNLNYLLLRLLCQACLS